MSRTLTVTYHRRRCVVVLSGPNVRAMRDKGVVALRGIAARWGVSVLALSWDVGTSQ